MSLVGPVSSATYCNSFEPLNLTTRTFLWRHTEKALVEFQYVVGRYVTFTKGLSKYKDHLVLLGRSSFIETHTIIAPFVDCSLLRDRSGDRSGDILTFGVHFTVDGSAPNSTGSEPVMITRFK